MKNIEESKNRQELKNKSNKVVRHSALYESLSLKYAKPGRNNGIKFPVYMSRKLMNSDIESLELSVRAYNCLKRMKYSTIGDLVNDIEKEENLLRIRNLGKNSAKEIMEKLLDYQYEMLTPEKRERFLKRIEELNG